MKYGVISLVLCISTRLRLVTILSLLVKYLVICHADPCYKSYICVSVAIKRWKRGDDNKLESNLRLEKVVASKQLRLVMETEDERRARLENAAATKTAQVSHGDRRIKKSKTGEDGSYHTAQVGPGSRG